MVYHCPYEADDDFFETLYRDIYVNRGNNLEKMKNMSFSELLTIYLSTWEKWKEWMKDSEIEDLLISKDVQSWDVSKVLMNQLLEKLDKDGNKKLLERIKKKFRKI